MMFVDRLNLIFLYFYNINERLDEMNCFQSAVFFADFLIVDNILNIGYFWASIIIYSFWCSWMIYLGYIWLE